MYRRRYRNYPYTYPVSYYGGGYDRVVVAAVPNGESCSCKAGGSAIEQKIKENPVLFVAGALLVGYLLAKKR